MIKRWGFLISNYIIFTSSAFAQGREPVSAGFQHKFSGDIDGGSEVSVDRWSINAGVPLYKKDGSFAALSISYAFDDYSFSGSYSPWSDVTKIGLGVPVFWQINERWRWASIFRGGVAYEDGADVGDAFTYGVVSSFDYKVSDSLTIGPGISFFKQFEYESSVFPILSIKWDITDKWLLSTGPSEGASAGANVSLKYDYNRNWDFYSGVFYQSNLFRLSESSQLAPDGIGQEVGVALYGVAKYRANERFSCSVIGGLSFGNEYNLYDSKGRDIEERDGDTTPFIGIRGNLEF